MVHLWYPSLKGKAGEIGYTPLLVNGPAVQEFADNDASSVVMHPEPGAYAP
jgi:hypothetical protein